jgi:nucleoside-triphosphatase THEP1
MRVGIGGPVGSGKTALVRALATALKGNYQIGVITNDIFTKEDEEILKKSGVLPDHHIIGVERNTRGFYTYWDVMGTFGTNYDGTLRHIQNNILPEIERQDCYG